MEEGERALKGLRGKFQGRDLCSETIKEGKKDFTKGGSRESRLSFNFPKERHFSRLALCNFF